MENTYPLYPIYHCFNVILCIAYYNFCKVGIYFTFCHFKIHITPQRNPKYATDYKQEQKNPGR